MPKIQQQIKEASEFIGGMKSEISCIFEKNSVLEFNIAEYAKNVVYESTKALVHEMLIIQRCFENEKASSKKKIANVHIGRILSLSESKIRQYRNIANQDEKVILLMVGKLEAGQLFWNGGTAFRGVSKS